jgi:O-antigen/teichoic acid export membrane protein
LFFRDSVHTLITRIFGYFFALGVQVIIARALGAGAKGELQIATFLFALLALFVGLGFERAIIFYLGAGKYNLRQIWYNSFSFLVISLVIVAVVWPLLAYLLRPVFGEIRYGLLLLLFLIVPFDRLLSLQLGMFNARGEIRKGNIVSLFRTFVFALLVGLFGFWLIPSSFGVIYAYIFSFMLASIAVFIYWRKSVGLLPGFRFDRKLIKDFFQYSVKGQIGNITSLLASRLDLLIMNYYLGKAAAGIYSVAINFSDLLMFLPFILAYVIFPHTARRNTEEGWRLTQRISRISLFVSFLVAILIAALAPIAIPILFSSDFMGALQPLWILLAGVIFLSTFRIVASGISGLGHPLIFSICTVIAVASSLVLNLILVPRYQAHGAAMASAISYFLAFVSLMIVIKFRFGYKLKAFMIIRKDDFILTKNSIMGILRRQ